jgi:hypothetical protein
VVVVIHEPRTAMPGWMLPLPSGMVLPVAREPEAWGRFVVAGPFCEPKHLTCLAFCVINCIRKEVKKNESEDKCKGRCPIATLVSLSGMMF